MTNPPRTESDLTTQLARDLVVQLAPQELPLFRAMGESYRQNREGAAQADTRDEMLGFGTGKVVKLITPMVLSVVGAFVAEASRQAQVSGPGTPLQQRLAQPLQALQSRQKLFNALTERFSLSELQTLCFRLNIDFESVEGEDKSAKVRALILYCERRDRVAELLDTAVSLNAAIRTDLGSGGRESSPSRIQWTPEQLASVHELVIVKARQLQLDDAKAHLLADALLGSLAYGGLTAS